MRKGTKYPRLRVHVRKGKNGQRRTYYFYDMRPDGTPDISLGKDYAEALAQWRELHERKPRIIGRLQEAFDRWERDELPGYDNEQTQRAYRRQVNRLAGVFGGMTWDEVTLPILHKYLQVRTAKTQGNRELSVLSIVWGKARLWGMTKLPWPAAGVKKWKNEEHAREFEVTDQLFEIVYWQADQVVRDCMDIATATGMRLTDARTVPLPADNILRFKASKTSKGADFDLALSQVLPDLIERRRAIKADHSMLLSTASGKAISVGMLRSRWDEARARAAMVAGIWNADDLARQVKAMYLRDMRKRAANLAGDLEEASKLLQHSSKKLTAVHYRQGSEKLKPVR